MLGKSPDQNQRDMFRPLLTDFINRDHELALLSDKIDWQYFENKLCKFYSHTGQPSMPIRFMVGCLVLKRIYNLGDETLADAWVRDPYMQYFCGRAYFEHKFPCDPSDFVHFRNRIGEEGMEIIFAYSVEMHGPKAMSDKVLSDTTVQGNNVSFPTDGKLRKRVIDCCNNIAQKEGITQRQTYTRTTKQALRDTHNFNHPKRRKRAKKAFKKLQTIAGRQIRELERKLTGSQLETYREELELYKRVITQKRNDKDKIYSIHKPFTACIAKGKAAKPYEFGNKIGIITSYKSNIILAVASFKGNPNDGRTIKPLLDQLEKNFNFKPKEVIYDRGARGVKQVNESKVSIPGKRLKKDSEYQARAKREKFRRRAAIEPVFGHLKSDHRMGENYLSGSKSPKMNAFLASAGWNFKKMMKKLKNKAKNIFGILLQKYYLQFYIIKI